MSNIPPQRRGPWRPCRGQARQSEGGRHQQQDSQEQQSRPRSGQPRLAGMDFKQHRCSECRRVELTEFAWCQAGFGSCEPLEEQAGRPQQWGQNERETGEETLGAPACARERRVIVGGGHAPSLSRTCILGLNESGGSISSTDHRPNGRSRSEGPSHLEAGSRYSLIGGEYHCDHLSGGPERGR